LGLLDCNIICCVQPVESYDSPPKIIQDRIKRADKRDDDTLKLQTKDSFTVFERLYHYLSILMRGSLLFLIIIKGVFERENVL